MICCPYAFFQNLVFGNIHKVVLNFYDINYYYYPFFGSEVRDLAGKEVIITGYVLAIDPLKGYYVLSKGPFSSCFFCGVGGPESIMELNPVDTDTKFKMDEIVTFKGILNLNYDDIYRSNYILDKAEVYQ